VRLWVFDTDHLSLYERGYQTLRKHVAAMQPGQLAITIITVEEQMRGRLAQIKKASSAPEKIQAYFWLHETLDLLSQFPVLDFNQDAHIKYAALCRQGIRIGTQDLRIAAIVLAADGVLVTRNRLHFGQVPDLIIENWS